MPKHKSNTGHNMVSEEKPGKAGFKPSGISPPEKIDFKEVQWEKWSRRWERYRTISFLNQMPEEYQVNQLIYVMGEEAEDLFERLGLKQTDFDDYTKIIEALNNHFRGGVNLVYERSKFFARMQAQGEPVEMFIADLHKIANRCNFENMKESLIMHKIIQGMANTQLSEKLQMECRMTLAMVEEKAKAAERVRRQQRVVRGEADRTEEGWVEAVRKGRRKGRGPFNRENSPNRGMYDKCLKCLLRKHTPEETCPARNAQCFKCKGRGHFARACRKTTVRGLTQRTVSTDEDVAETASRSRYSDSELSIGNVTQNRNPSWEVAVTVENQLINFRVDTGADVTVISEEEYKRRFKGRVVLHETDRKLFGPGKSALKVMGEFRADMMYKGRKQTRQNIFVLEGQQQALLGLPAIQALGVIKWIGKVTQRGIKVSFPKLFEGIGEMKTDPYKIEIKAGAEPNAARAPRRVPINLRDKVRTELEKLEEKGIITRVNKATDWVANMVVVPKPNNEVRICVDYLHLNAAIKRERLMVPTVEEILSQVRGAKFFSKIDCRSGYFQIKLHKDSRELTTFITPFGRFYFNRLPMGISSAPEVYHRKMVEILSGLEGVVTLLDDSLIFAETEEEHDVRLEKVLKRLNEHGVTLNEKKCEFKVQETKFLGYKISREGIAPDEEKVKAVLELPNPQNSTEVRRFLGMVNYYIKFLPKLAQLSQPLRELLKKCNSWIWGPDQQESFDGIKVALTKAPILSFFQLDKNTRVAADTSLTGIGAVMEQEVEHGKWKPVQFASRSLSETEKRYSNIEREALGVTWACERMREFLIGRPFIIQTDHKPLLTLFGKKALNELTPRIQRFRMRLATFNYSMQHVAGKRFFTPDTLSRAPLKDTNHEEDILLNEDREEGCINHGRVGQVEDPMITEIMKEQNRDEVLREVKEVVHRGWPATGKNNLGPYRRFRADLWEKEGLLMYKERMVVPARLKGELLRKIHQGHGGERRCMKRARTSVWWPNIGQDIKRVVEECPDCVESRSARKEPLIGTALPNGPWEKVAIDYFNCQGKWYILIVDYYSRYLDVHEMRTMTTRATITYLKTIFAKVGIPLQVRCDSGTNLTSHELNEFARKMGFKIVPASPKYPQSNGLAEAMVKVAKKLVKGDLELGLLAYRTTPLDQGPSPGELLMGRRLRGTLPLRPEQRAPQWPDMEVFRRADGVKKESAERQYNRRHGTRTLPVLKEGVKVWVKDIKTYATVVRKNLEGPRRYEIRVPNGRVLLRNRASLVAA